jgi:peptidoglycan hydrolase-like protein with peptidoglycan-binding domain
VRPSSLLAVVVSAAVGIGLGIAAGLLLDREPAPFADPLALGIPFRNQPCGPGVLFTVGRGGAGQVGAAVTLNHELDLAYLRTDRSCPTVWTPDPGPPPPYVAYAGPYDSRPAACDAQFRAGHRGGVVTMLNPSATETVQCLCYVSLPQPRLHGGMATEGTDGIWLRQLQNMLVDMGRGTDQDLSGAYDATTATKIRDFQRDNDLGATGEVDQPTWDKLKQQGCKLYKS